MLTILRNKMVSSSLRVGLIFLLGSALILMAKKISVLSEDNNRLKNNLASYRERITELQSEDGSPMYQTDALEFRLRELSLLYPRLLDEIRNLKVKPRRVESISENGMESHIRIKAGIKDCVTKDSVKVREFSYQDEWYSVNGFATSDTQFLNISSTDTLLQVVFRGERERPWLWIFSPRKLTQRIKLSNPNSRIVYSQTIKVQKRKGKK